MSKIICILLQDLDRIETRNFLMKKEQDIDFLVNKMHIDINHLITTLNSKNVIKHKKNIIDQIHQYINIAQSKDKKCDGINEVYSQINDDKANIVLDSMRNAILSFCRGGLHDLWVYQENQCWYPKIIIKEILEPNDIDSLDDILIIYRGCNLSEIQNKEYGQAWTTAYMRAKEFAVEHYLNEDWFKIEYRVVLKAKINKGDIYYSDQSNHEKEIVVEPSCLLDIKLFKTYKDILDEK